MEDVTPFGMLAGLVAAAILLAVLSNRLSARLRVPAPALFLVGAAIASDLVPVLQKIPTETVQRIVTVALVVILFDGGMHIGRRRLRSAAGAILWIGTAGTLVTAAAVAVLAHFLFGLDWTLSLLIGTALAPTDPAVVFSVLGRREVSGRSGVILEGESGANDPVGIALMVALLATAGVGGFGAVWTGVTEFVLQMVVGAAVGIAGGWGLSVFIRRVPLPSEGLYALRTLASVFVIYGVATVAHGSGFLAVFIVGIMLGDVRAPYKREIERFHGSLASLGEIVAFTVLGLTVSLKSLPDGNAWQIGLVLAVLLAFVVRPLLVGVLLLPIKLQWGERLFILWSGLKGAVPILLGTFVIASQIPGSVLAYDIIFVVVAFSVVVQGGLVPFLANRLGVPMRLVEPEPWSLGVRLRQEPDGVRRFNVAEGSAADGTAIEDLELGEDVWISLVSRDGRLLAVRGDTVLAAGDEVVAIVDPEHPGDSTHVFTAAPG